MEIEILEEHVLQIIRDNPHVIVEAIESYQQQQQQEQEASLAALIEKLKTNRQEIIGMSPTSGAHPDEARLVIIAFMNFGAANSASTYQTIQQFMDKHCDEVTLVFKHYPTTPQELEAAKFAWAAHKQSKFWYYSDGLYNNQDSLSEDLYMEIASDIDLDIEAFEYHRNSNAASDAIESDIKLAQPISASPFILMNEKVFSDSIMLEEMEQILEQSR